MRNYFFVVLGLLACLMVIAGCSEPESPLKPEESLIFAPELKEGHIYFNDTLLVSWKNREAADFYIVALVEGHDVRYGAAREKILFHKVIEGTSTTLEKKNSYFFSDREKAKPFSIIVYAMIGEPIEGQHPHDYASYDRHSYSEKLWFYWYRSKNEVEELQAYVNDNKDKLVLNPIFLTELYGNRYRIISETPDPHSIPVGGRYEVVVEKFDKEIYRAIDNANYESKRDDYGIFEYYSFVHLPVLGDKIRIRLIWQIEGGEPVHGNWSTVSVAQLHLNALKEDLEEFKDLREEMDDIRKDMDDLRKDLEHPLDSVTIFDFKIGDGAIAEKGKQVWISYVGMYIHQETGQRVVFDDNEKGNFPFTFVIGSGQVISGLNQGVVGMRVGGKRLVTIQPEMGYGNRKVGPIPPNSTLQFEIRLLKVR